MAGTSVTAIKTARCILPPSSKARLVNASHERLLLQTDGYTVNSSIVQAHLNLPRADGQGFCVEVVNVLTAVEAEEVSGIGIAGWGCVNRRSHQGVARKFLHSECGDSRRDQGAIGIPKLKLDGYGA